MTAKLSLTETYRASYDWWEIVTRHRDEIEVDDPVCGDVELWDAAAEVAGYDPNDPEVWVSAISRVDERHTAIHVGDLVVFGGYGADVVFVRPS